jgi:hypothetical protein
MMEGARRHLDRAHRTTLALEVVRGMWRALAITWATHTMGMGLGDDGPERMIMLVLGSSRKAANSPTSS